MNSYFPKDFEDSRRRFREHVEKNKSAITDAGFWKIPSQTDQDLSVDYAYFKAKSQKPRHLYILSSGIHGVEAYAGSAAQELWWQEIYPKFNPELDGLFLVHSMNPYGFKYHDRLTENSVNLNRNCSVVPGFFETKNDESLRLSDLHVPKEPVQNLESHLLKNLKQDEIDQFIKATGLGQFKSKQGLEYGGAQLEPQIAAFANYLKGILTPYQNLILLDLHTGLGHRGRLHLLPGDTPESHDQSLFEELFQPTQEADIYEFTEADAEGFYPTYGSFNNMIPELKEPHQRVIALTLEFGTLGHDPQAQYESLNRWMLEHQGRNYGYASKEIETKVRELYLRKFYPLESDWQESILQASRALFRKLFLGTH